MSLDLKAYNRLKRAVDEKKEEADRASGAFDQALKQMQDEFGVDSIENAKSKLEVLTAKEEAAKEAFEAELAAFQKEHGHVLGVA